MLTKFLLPPPKQELDSKATIEDIYSDDDSNSKEKITAASTLNEINPLWHFTLGDERFYIIFKKIPGAKYKFNLECNDSEIHITAEYIPSDAEVTLIGHILKLNTSFITPHFGLKTLQTVIRPPKPILNNPILHSKSEESFAVISYPLKKSFSLVIE